MSKPVVAVDIDDVLVPHGEVLLGYLNQLHNKQVSLDKFYSLEDLMEGFGRTESELRQNVHDFLDSDEFTQGQPTAEALEVLDRLSHRYTFVAVTARPGIAHQTTKRWLETHFPRSFHSLHYANLNYDWGKNVGINKIKLCQQVAAATLIDDALHHITDAAEAGIRGLLYGDYFWNQADALPVGVTRVKDWLVVEEVLLGQDS